ITPAPAHPRVTPRITTASSPTSYEPPNPSPVAGGPASSSYVIPPRPKPGRKPATDEPASKRKAQNRESQRAFRARKAAKLTEMQDHVETTQQKHKHQLMEKEAIETRLREEIRELKEKNRRLETEVAAMTRERDYWKSNRHSQSSQSLPTNDLNTYNTPRTLIGCGSCKSDGECACMDQISKLDSSPAFMSGTSLDTFPPRRISLPMEMQPLVNDPYVDREIDFTSQFSSKKNRHDTKTSINFMTQPHEPCGFCTDDNNCLCRDQSLQLHSSMDQNVHTPIGSRQPPTDRSVSAPGTCDDCMRDPKKKAWCQRVAQLKRSETDYFSSRPRSRNSAMSSPLDPMEPRIAPGPTPHINSSNRSSIGCSDAYKLFDGRVPVDQDNMDWSSLNPHSPAIRKDTLPAIDPSRTYSALELDTAGVIATLQQTIGPLLPRREDGPHANLVNIAESQRTGSSPAFEP
ncbi:hypothetical protein B0J11DRAFT_426877, partial [Dendryphion nanum]